MLQPEQVTLHFYGCIQWSPSGEGMISIHGAPTSHFPQPAAVHNTLQHASPGKWGTPGTEFWRGLSYEWGEEVRKSHLRVEIFPSAETLSWLQATIHKISVGLLN